MLNMRIVCGARATPILLCVLGCACACACFVGVWVYGCVCDTRVEVMLRLHAHSANMGVCDGERAAATTGHKNCNVYD